MQEDNVTWLASRYPTLDMQSLRILWLISEHVGLSMADIAETLRTNYSHVQFHVSMMALGKTGRQRHGLNLVYIEPDPLDKRRKILSLTERGQRVIKAVFQ